MEYWSDEVRLAGEEALLSDDFEEELQHLNMPASLVQIPAPGVKAVAAQKETEPQRGIVGVQQLLEFKRERGDILRVGENADAFFVLASGSARVVKAADDGSEVALDMLQRGDSFAFDNPGAITAFRYLVGLINRDHVAPPASDTNDNGDFSRNQFLQGRMAMFQSGTYNLAAVADRARFRWGVA